ncbi:MAG TPA: cupin domain-containing protein [Acidobacteriota bacterium]|nr:cupin domain-containing protein [Acidobacteriota bacterium]
MVDEADLRRTPGGTVATTDGWFVLHASDAPWMRSVRFGAGCRLEGESGFPDVGINLRVLDPGKPACLYHRENAQEDFFVISGEGILVVEEQERPLRAGDFIHCPAETNHVLVGAGDAPCVVLMIGYRPDPKELCYPVSAASDKYGASVAEETPSPQEAYGARDIEPIASIWPLY